jgi:tight adherence protein B
LGIFQVVMDLRTNQQRKVLDRLRESRSADRELRVKESLLRKRAAELQTGASGFDDVEAARIVTRLQRVLDQADINWSASRLLIHLIAAGTVAGVAFALLRFHPLACGAVAAAVVVVPLLWLLRKRRKRIKTLIEQLPEVFDLMSQSLARRAIRSPAPSSSSRQQMPEPIAGEFALVFHEQNLGLTIEDALMNMANRIDQLDVRFFVTAVLIQRQTGGDLAEVLDKIGKVIRDRVQLVRHRAGAHRGGPALRMGAAGPAGLRLFRHGPREPGLRPAAYRHGVRKNDAGNGHRHGPDGHGDDQEDRQYQGVEL